MTKRILLSILALLVACCVGLSAVSIVTGAFIFAAGRPAHSAAPQPTPTLETSVELPTLSPAARATESLPAAVTAQMDRIQQEVVQLRGLPVISPITRDVLTSEQLGQKVKNDFFDEYTHQDAERDARLLSALGLLPPGFDLYDLYVRLYSEQVAGYYEPKTKEMFVIGDEGFQGPQRMTYAHEFTHALQDQHYDLRNGLNSNQTYCKTHSEYCAAVQALVEGDATMIEQSWLFRYASSQDRLDIQDFYQTYKSPVYDSAPLYLQKDFLFPYQQGLEFVQSLYDKGGYAAVDEAFRRPPLTTHQILHPDDYPSVSPKSASIPDLLPAFPQGWSQLDRNGLGEWYSYLVLAFGRDQNFRLTATEARQATTGWAGDQYAFYGSPDGQQSALVLLSDWNNISSAGNFWDALAAYAALRWGKPTRQTTDRLEWQNTADGLVTLVHSQQDTLWVIAPDSPTSAKILSLIPEFQEK